MKTDLAQILKRNGWEFDWKYELSDRKRQVYKLTIVGSVNVIQGLLSIEAKEDHIFMHLLENAPFNKGRKKVYRGVAGNLVAFACKLSFEKGFDGNVSFVSKTQLVNHYIETLGAFHFGGRIMIIETRAARKLVDRYFN